MKNLSKICFKFINHKTKNYFQRIILKPKVYYQKNQFSFCNLINQNSTAIVGEMNLDTESMFQKALNMKNNNRFEESIAILKICLTKLEDSPNKTLHFKILNELSLIYFYQGKRNESINLAEKAKEYAQSNFGLYTDETYSTNLLLSGIHNKYEKYDKCLAYDLENLHIIEYKYGRESMKYAHACNDVGLSHILNDNINEAEEYLNECVKIIKKLKDDKCKEMIIPLFNFSLLNKKKQLTKTAYKFAEEAILLNDKFNNKYEFSFIYIQLKMNLADIYYKLEYYHDSISILMKLVKFSKEIKDCEKKDLYNINIMISNNYKALGENNLAEEYIKEGKRILEK